MAASKGLKGIREKLIASLKSAATDYKNAAKDTVTSMKERPAKATFYTGLCLLGLQLSRTSPTEKDYRSAVAEKVNEMALLSDKVRNKESDAHLQKLSNYFAKGQIRFKSLVFFSLVYYSDYDKDNRYYESQCKFVKPRWSEFHKRIVDIGCYRQWWVLRYRTTDYDVNFDELPKEINSILDKMKDSLKRMSGISYFGNPAVPMSEQKKVKKAVEVVE